MAFSAAIVGGMAAVGSEAYKASEARKARKAAEQEAAAQRETLAALQNEPPPEMPSPIPTADPEARKARRRSISAMARRTGRASTILTGGGTGDALGA